MVEDEPGGHPRGHQHQIPHDCQAREDAEIELEIETICYIIKRQMSDEAPSRIHLRVKTDLLHNYGLTQRRPGHTTRQVRPWEIKKWEGCLALRRDG